MDHTQASYNLLTQLTQSFNLLVPGVKLRAINGESNLSKAIKSIYLKFKEILNSIHLKLRGQCFPKIMFVRAS